MIKKKISAFNTTSTDFRLYFLDNYGSLLRETLSRSSLWAVLRPWNFVNCWSFLRGPENENDSAEDISSHYKKARRFTVASVH